MPREQLTNAELAANAVCYARSFIKISATSPYFRLTLEEREHLNKTLATVRFFLDDSEPLLPTSSSFYRIVSRIKKFKTGNCLELSRLAMEYVLRNSTKPNAVELFCYNRNTGDHVFLVINRKANSSPTDPASWGDAYIADPLLGKSYPASEYYFNLVDFKQISAYPLSDYITIPYNPRINVLQLMENGGKILEEVNSTAITCRQQIEKCFLLKLNILLEKWIINKQLNYDTAYLDAQMVKIKNYLDAFYNSTNYFSGFQLMDVLKGYYQKLIPIATHEIFKANMTELSQQFENLEHYPTSQEIINQHKKIPITLTPQLKQNLENHIQEEPTYILTLLCTLPSNERFTYLMSQLDKITAVFCKKIGTIDYANEFTSLLCRIINTLPEINQIVLFIKKLIGCNIIYYRKDMPYTHVSATYAGPILMGRQTLTTLCRQSKEELEVVFYLLEQPQPFKLTYNWFNIWEKPCKQKTDMTAIANYSLTLSTT